ncbi:MAG: glycosyltransferase family 4 protein [Cyanobacteria bacterium]|nr:glycosyltransferase family 4 protein [Cyanobacteriota bacterium]
MPKTDSLKSTLEPATKTLKVLFICHDGALYGSQESLLQLISSLNPQEITVYVSIARPGPLVEKLEALPQVHVLHHQRIGWFKHDPRSGLARICDILSLIYSCLFRLTGTMTHIHQYDIELVHTNSVVSLEGALAAWLMRIPHVWHIRELFYWDNPKLFPTLGKRLTRFIIECLSSRILCISSAVQKQFNAVSKAVLVPNAFLPPPESSAILNRDYLLPTESQCLFQLGYVGRISEGKRLHLLLQALSLLKQQHSSFPFHLTVVGGFVDVPYQTLIETMIQDLDLSKHVNLVGYQTKEVLYQYYAQWDCLVLPSLNEPFGRVLIEAMSFGLPCIASNSGGVPDIITQLDVGVLFQPDSAEDLAAQLNALFFVPDTVLAAKHRQAISQAARRSALDRFNIESHKASILSVYKACLTRQESI